MSTNTMSVLPWQSGLEPDEVAAVLTATRERLADKAERAKILDEVLTNALAPRVRLELGDAAEQAAREAQRLQDEQNRESARANWAALPYKSLSETLELLMFDVFPSGNGTLTVLVDNGQNRIPTGSEGRAPKSVLRLAEKHNGVIALDLKNSQATVITIEPSAADSWRRMQVKFSIPKTLCWSLPSGEVCNLFANVATLDGERFSRDLVKGINISSNACIPLPGQHGYAWIRGPDRVEQPPKGFGLPDVGAEMNKGLDAVSGAKPAIWKNWFGGMISQIADEPTKA